MGKKAGKAPKPIWKGLRAAIVFVALFVAVKDAAVMLGVSEGASLWMGFVLGVVGATGYVWRVHKNSSTGIHAPAAQVVKQEEH